MIVTSVFTLAFKNILISFAIFPISFRYISIAPSDFQIAFSVFAIAFSILAVAPFYKPCLSRQTPCAQCKALLQLNFKG